MLKLVDRALLMAESKEAAPWDGRRLMVADFKFKISKTLNVISGNPEWLEEEMGLRIRLGQIKRMEVGKIVQKWRGKVQFVRLSPLLFWEHIPDATKGVQRRYWCVEIPPYPPFFDRKVFMPRGRQKHKSTY